MFWYERGISDEISIIFIVSIYFKGYKLNVFDVSAEACDAMKAKGAQVFGSTQELAKSSQYVLTMLPNNDIVTQTYENMIKDGVNSSTLFVDSSTVDPSVSQYVQKIVSKAGASFVDAPVSGGVIGVSSIPIKMIWWHVVVKRFRIFSEKTFDSQKGFN